MDAAWGEPFVYLTDHFGGACAEVEVHLAFGQALVKSVLAERDSLDLDGTRKRREDDVGLLRDLAGGVGPLRAHLEGGCGRLAADVVDDEFVAAADGVEGDWAAHCSEADESYFHWGCSFGLGVNWAVWRAEVFTLTPTLSLRERGLVCVSPGGAQLGEAYGVSG